MTDPQTPPPSSNATPSTTPETNTPPPAQTPPPAETPAGDKPATDPAAENKPAEGEGSFLDGNVPEEKKDGEEGDKPKEGEDADKDKEGDEDKGEQIKFEDFKIEPDMVVDDATRDALMNVVNNDKLSKAEMVQELLNLHMKQVNSQTEEFLAHRQAEREALKSDPVIGGQNVNATKTAANKVIQRFARDPKFGGDEETFKGVVNFLTLIGGGDNRHVVRMLVNVARHTGNDQFHGGNSGGTEKKTAEDILFGGTK